MTRGEPKPQTKINTFTVIYTGLIMTFFKNANPVWLMGLEEEPNIQAIFKANFEASKEQQVVLKAWCPCVTRLIRRMDNNSTVVPMAGSRSWRILAAFARPGVDRQIEATV